MTAETAHPVEGMTIAPMERHELPAVLDLYTRALRDNPSNVGMFGPDPERRLRSLRVIYSMLLADMALAPVVARSGSRILGAVAVSPPETCFYRRSPARVRRIGLLGPHVSIESPDIPWRHVPSLLRLGLPALERAGTMLRAGASHDPVQRHWHVELVGVEPEVQGQGIGGRLMAAALRPVDAAAEPAYLETDKPENVTFYRRCGFEVTGQEEALGVPTWYMERLPATDPAAHS